MAEFDDNESTSDTGRLDALLASIGLPLSIKIEDGMPDTGSYRDEAALDDVPGLSAYAGKTGALFLGDRRIADARLVDGVQGLRAILSNAVAGPDGGALRELILDTRLPVIVELGTRDIPVSELAGLEEGDIVRFGHLAGEPANLMVAQPRCLIGRGEVVVIHENKGIRLVETCDPEPSGRPVQVCTAEVPTVRATFVLGSTSISIRDLAAQSEGTLVRLDTMASEPARVLLSNGLALEAEAVMDEEYLAARIIGRYPAPAGEPPVEDTPAALAAIPPEKSEETRIPSTVDPGQTGESAGSAEPEPAMEELRVELARMLESTPDTVAGYLQSLLRSSEHRKEAAIIVGTIGIQAASGMCRLLHEDDLETLTFELARLEYTEPARVRSALAALVKAGRNGADAVSGGINYARELLEGTLGFDKATDIMNRLTDSLQERPFDFLRRIKPELVLQSIQNEHPQTIALVLSYMEPAKAAYILQRLPMNSQPDIIKRISLMDQTTPGLLHAVERVLETKLSALANEEATSSGGVSSAVGILNYADRTTEKGILEALEEDCPELAEDIKKRMFIFEDIVMLDDRSMQKVIREVDAVDLTCALKGVDTDVQEKIFRNVSKRTAMAIKEDMEYMGPVRIMDVEAAQQKIVGVIRHLEACGEIIVARGDDSYLIS